MRHCRTFPKTAKTNSDRRAAPCQKRNEPPTHETGRGHERPGFFVSTLPTPHDGLTGPGGSPHVYQYRAVPATSSRIPRALSQLKAAILTHSARNTPETAISDKHTQGIYTYPSPLPAVLTPTAPRWEYQTAAEGGTMPEGMSGRAARVRHASRWQMFLCCVICADSDVITEVT